MVQTQVFLVPHHFLRYGQLVVAVAPLVRQVEVRQQEVGVLVVAVLLILVNRQI
jgi:hypothetical protein